MKRELATHLRDKLNTLHDVAHQAIDEAKVSHAFNDGLVCLLSEAICEVEKTTKVIQDQVDDEDLSHNAQLLQNLLHVPICPRSAPHKLMTMHDAAQDKKEMHEVILACVLDEDSTEVMLSDLKQICCSINHLIEEFEACEPQNYQ